MRRKVIAIFMMCVAMCTGCGDKTDLEQVKKAVPATEEKTTEVSISVFDDENKKHVIAEADYIDDCSSYEAMEKEAILIVQGTKRDEKMEEPDFEGDTYNLLSNFEIEKVVKDSQEKYKVGDAIAIREDIHYDAEEDMIIHDNGYVKMQEGNQYTLMLGEGNAVDEYYIIGGVFGKIPSDESEVILYSDEENAKYSLAAEIDKKVKNFEKEIYVNNKKWYSSNPYDFKDTQYYNDLLSYGVEGVSILEEKFTDGELEGLNQYLVGLAIQEITETNPCEATGQTVATGEEMAQVWEEFVRAMPEKMAEIVESDKNSKKKLEEIEHYGLFGRMYVKDIVEGTQSSEMLHRKKIKCQEKDKEKFREYVNQNPLEQKQLEQTKECFEKMYNRHRR